MEDFIEKIMNSKYLVAIVFSLFVTLLVLRFYPSLYIIDALLVLTGAFLVYNLILYICNNWRSKKNSKGTESEISLIAKNKLDKQRIIANKDAEQMLSFFRSLGPMQLEAATAFYNHAKHPDGKDTERYIKNGEEPGFSYLGYLHNFQYHDRITNYERLCIWCDNEMECFNGCSHHILFDPLFYSILDNYIKTGRDSYPREGK